MFVCQKHVLNGLKVLNVPNIRKTDKIVKCFFCKKRSDYEFYYVDYDYLLKLPKKISIGNKI